MNNYVYYMYIIEDDASVGCSEEKKNQHWLHALLNTIKCCQWFDQFNLANIENIYI